MPQPPPEAALPHPLTQNSAGTAIRLPTPTTPAPEGALAQLAAIDKTVAADLQDWQRAYADHAAPGAPPPTTTGVYQTVHSLATNNTARPPWMDYEIGWGLIKGTTDRGRIAVVCVLGVLTTTFHGEKPAIKRGFGDCEAMQWTGVDWRIAPGPLAAPAPQTWPSTSEAVAAGYREMY